MSADKFGDRLRELRTSAGISRKELATKAGFRSEAGIRNLEQGLYKPAWETVLAICKALGLECTAFSQELAEKPQAKVTAKVAKPNKAAEGVTTPARPRTRSRPATTTRAKKPSGKKAD